MKGGCGAVRGWALGLGLTMLLLLAGCGGETPAVTVKATATPEVTVPSTPDPEALREAENQKAYDDALALLENGEYLPAYDAFIALEDYRDSSALAEQSFALEEQAVYDEYCTPMTAEAMRQYLVLRPEGLHAGEAKERLHLLEPYEGTVQALMLRDVLAAEVTGYSISQVVLHLQNTSGFPLAVTLPYGAVCRAKTTGLQDMLLLEEAAFVLAPGEVLMYEAKTVCLDIGKDIPGTQDSFLMEDLPPEHPFLVLLPLLERQSFAVAQSVVWLYTDEKTTEEDILEALVYSNDEAVIEKSDVEAAKALLQDGLAANRPG